MGLGQNDRWPPGFLAALGIWEKVCHVSALYRTLVGTATLEDAK